MSIQKDHKLPMYYQIKNIILSQISEGIYHPGDMIPSERILGEQYKISRMTVRQALNELVQEGKLYRERGRGTFVSAPRFFQSNLMSFTETLLEQGCVPSTEILEFSTVKNLAQIAPMLDLSAEQSFYKVKRLRLLDGTPVALETAYIPIMYCPELTPIDISQSLYKVLREKYGHTVESTSSTMEACISNKMMMQVFGFKKQVPLLKVEGVSICQEGKKIFYELSYYRADIYTYQVDIHKRGMKRR